MRSNLTPRWTSQHRDSGNTEKLASLISECHVITNKYPEAASVLQQVHKESSAALKILPGAHRLKWGKALNGPLL
jgi:hypothetical protein